MSDTIKPARVGVIGCGNISDTYFKNLPTFTDLVVTACADLDMTRAKAKAVHYGLRALTVEALLADPEVDAVVNLTIPASHAAVNHAALSAGKHVYTEKPLGVTRADGRQAVDLARAKGLRLGAAPDTFLGGGLQTARQLIDEGAIGEVRLVQAFFGITLPAGPNIRLDPALGGGATLDLGCYAVSLARLAVGRRPLRVTAHALNTDGGVDLRLTGSIHYEGGAVAQVGCAMDTAVHRAATIVGSSGLIETDYQNHTGPKRPCYLRLRRGTGWDVATEPVPFDTGDGFRLEAEHFAGLVAGTAPAGDDMLLTLQNMATLEALLASARAGGAAVSVPAP